MPQQEGGWLTREWVEWVRSGILVGGPKPPVNVYLLEQEEKKGKEEQKRQLSHKEKLL
ncbi:MAG: hypothetical protein G01um101470_53 [Parcubacteria group bacterium Gr01-1014_70]|nr:MAG: hypothetical protein G01um101470_53 [Parcubacteria group bacterium Gr01-1014_70]